MTDFALGQADVELDILEVLETGTIMATADITAAVKRRLSLGPADLARANKRHNESKIDQIIANALQEKRNLCGRGLIVRTGKGLFQITGAGRDHLAEHRWMVKDAMAILDQLARESE